MGAKLVIVAFILALGSAVPREAMAEAQSSVAEATALFEHARVLMDAGRHAEACPLFARSQALDTHVGTMVNLAYCYENIGKTASSWAWWLKAAVAYGAKGRTDEAEVARARAAQLEGRLLRVTIAVARQPAPDPIDVRLDGESLPREQWNTATPVDPGAHVVEAIAPGRRKWSAELDVGEKSVPSVVVPALEAEADRGWTKKAALGLGAGGLAAVAVGSAFGAAAILAHSRELQYCSGTNCNANGVHEHSQMKADAAIADTAFAVGAGALIGAAILWFAPPHQPSRFGVTVRPTIARDGASLSIHEVW